MKLRCTVKGDALTQGERMQITASFNIFGYQTRELDLTPALGLSLIVIVFLSLAQVSHWQ